MKIDPSSMPHHVPPQAQNKIPRGGQAESQGNDDAVQVNLSDAALQSLQGGEAAQSAPNSMAQRARDYLSASDGFIGAERGSFKNFGQLVSQMARGMLDDGLPEINMPDEETPVVPDETEETTPTPPAPEASAEASAEAAAVVESPDGPDILPEPDLSQVLSLLGTDNQSLLDQLLIDDAADDDEAGSTA